MKLLGAAALLALIPQPALAAGETERDYSPIGGVDAWDWRPTGEGRMATDLNVATPFLAAEQSLYRPGFPRDVRAFIRAR